MKTFWRKFLEWIFRCHHQIGGNPPKCILCGKRFSKIVKEKLNNYAKPRQPQMRGRP